MAARSTAPSKSDLTRAKIAQAALDSFRERGYEQTTIRLIASEAGISVGNAYYYFPTKTHLVQELYLRVQEEHRMRATGILDSTTDLVERLEGALLTGLDAIGPYHDSAPGFLSAAISPAAAVSPFGPDSAEPRGMALSVFRDVVDGSTTQLPADLRRELPELLWLAYLGLALYWVYDESEGQAKSRTLARRGAKLIGMMLPLTRLPFAKKFLAEALDLVRLARS